jgi:uncharacterized membrane protein
VPGIVIALSYSIAFYLMVDKDMEPSKSISESVRLTDGYKGTIFLASLVLGLISAVVSFIFSGISGGSWWGVLLNLIVTLLISVVSVGMSAYMYRKLADIEVVEEQPAQM